MPIKRWYEAPRRLALLFLAVTLIPAVALVWLTIELVEKDRDLEKQHAQERLERVADKIVGASHQRLIELESRLRLILTAEGNAPPDGTVLLIAGGEQVTADPVGALAFHPVLPHTRQTPRSVFAEGERYEHQQSDWGRAIERFEALVHSDDPAIRAGALLRLGRNQGKAGQIDAALATFAELARLGTTDVEGFPAALLALEARCGILEKAARQPELVTGAHALRTGLASGTWPLLRGPYDFYMEEARRWSGEPAETDAERNARVIAAAFQSLHERWVTGSNPPQKTWLIVEGSPVLVATAASQGRLVALVGGADFLEAAWDASAVQVLLTDGEGHPIMGKFPDPSAPQAVLTGDTSGLPWTLRVASRSPEADTSAAKRQRQLLLAGLAMVLLLLGGSTYFTLRGVTRELAVARLQSDFVAAVSHEFRTPLASVRHLSDMLSKGRVSEGQRQRSYDFLARESERLEKLVEGLLGFGRVEGGAYRYRFARIDAAELVRELVSEFQENVRPKGYRIELSIDVDGASVLADREALSRAIWNLLDNAVKYSPGSDTVWVVLARERDSVEIRVRDRGLGIASSEHEDIFRKFVRGSNVRAEQIKGTGIGLAMVQHIVEAHHGSIRVESRPDQGSTFALRLPIERPT